MKNENLFFIFGGKRSSQIFACEMLYNIEPLGLDHKKNCCETFANQYV